MSDVVVKDAREERQARNIRRVAGVFCGRKAGFEIVQGLLDRLMRGLGVGNLGDGKGKEESGYYIAAFDGAFPFHPFLEYPLTFLDPSLRRDLLPRTLRQNHVPISPPRRLKPNDLHLAFFDNTHFFVDGSRGGQEPSSGCRDWRDWDLASVSFEGVRVGLPLLEYGV